MKKANLALWIATLLISAANFALVLNNYLNK
jgi:hypothetical protein